MFKKLASEALGLSDIGSVIQPQDFDKVDADDYVMHEDGEKIYFLIKSKTDEYCFTNKALIHVDGTSAVSKKRTLRRFSYSANKIRNVELETAGTVDLDVEIKFKMGDEVYSIDVHKKYIEEIKDLYKALLAISEITKENEYMLNFAQQSLNVASTTLGRVASKETNLVEDFSQLNEAAFNWLMETSKKYNVKDYGYVFEKYINN
ncbi:PH domain-containing protein [Cytobacillus sp. FJAT-54145]|uniref:PH domain-containing protein n=1 Tax=Cytobacillus spartinae TaxID=3299023 RepID=A0ABW6K735_9BACI